MLRGISIGPSQRLDLGAERRDGYLAQRAELRKAVGELRVEAAEDRVEIWSSHSLGAALSKVAGALEQMTYPAHS